MHNSTLMMHVCKTSGCRCCCCYRCNKRTNEPTKQPSTAVTTLQANKQAKQPGTHYMRLYITRSFGDDADLISERETTHIRESKRNQCTFLLITNTLNTPIVHSMNKSCARHTAHSRSHDSLESQLLEIHFLQADSMPFRFDSIEFDVWCFFPTLFFFLSSLGLHRSERIFIVIYDRFFFSICCSEANIPI